MTTDKRAAAIAALGGPEKARDRIAIFRAMMGDHVDASAFCDLVLHAIEADDGRALLHKAKAQMQESHDWVSDRNQKWGLARAMQVIDEILAAPEQPAPEPAASVSIRDGALQGAPTRGPVLTDRAEIDALKKRAFDAAQPEPAAPHADDEARIAEAEELMTLVVDTRPSVETLRTLVRSAVTMMRSLAAGKAKAEADLHAAHVAFGTIDNALGGHGWTSIDDVVARAQGVKPRNEQHRRMDAKHVADLNNDIADLRANLADAQAEVERLTGVIDDTTNTEATNADTVADLRAKLAEAEKKKDAFFQRLSEAMETLDHIRDNHVQGDDVSDHEGIAQAVDRIAAERDAAVAKLADAERQTQRWKVAPKKRKARKGAK